MKYIVWSNDGRHEIEVELRNGLYAVSLDGKKYGVDARRVSDTSVYSLLIAGKSYEVEVRPDGEYLSVFIQGELYRIAVRDELWAKSSGPVAGVAPGGVQHVRAPMPGLVVEIRVAKGERVEQGQPLVIVEAMKMQNELCSHGTGVVKEIAVKEQETVNQDQVMMIIEP
ncbi:MAG: biotin/lipoyl-containing protein [Candidatus Eisenbacteria bacterium]